MGGNFLLMSASMIVDYLDVLRVFSTPTETNSKLIVYANAVLTRPIALQGFESIARRSLQKTQ
jgi:hypothetical protein